MPDYDKMNRLWQRKHFSEVYYVTINGQITGKLDPLARTKKAITPNILQHTLSLRCLVFLPNFKRLVPPASLCKWSNLQVQWSPVSPLCAGVRVSVGDTNWGEKSGLISRQRRSWEKFAGKRQLLSQIFQHHHVTPGVWVSVSRLCHVSWLLDLPRDTRDTRPPAITVITQSPVTLVPDLIPGSSQLSELCC